MKRIFPLQLLFIANLLCWNSCTKDDPDPSDTTPVNPIVTEVGIPVGDAVTGTIGVTGGTLTSADGKLSVTVPAEALTNNTAVGIQPISNNAPLGVGSGYRLTPEGTTFAKPIKLTFYYDKETLQGSPEDFLWIVTQATNGTWNALLKSAVDTIAKTVTVETTHFSDWVLGRFIDMALEPSQKIIKVGNRLRLSVTAFARTTADEEDELAPLVPIKEPTGDELEYLAPLTPILPAAERLLRFRIKSWSLNGSNAPVSGTYGKLTSAKLTAEYTAPAKRPQPSQVAVSARLEVINDAGQVKTSFLLVSNITIIDSDYYLRLTVDGSEYVYFQFGFNGEVPKDPDSYELVNCGMTDVGSLGMAASYYRGGAFSYVFVAEFSRPTKGSRSMTCFYDENHDRDDMNFSVNDSGGGYQSHYMARWRQDDACESEGRCPGITVTFTEFTPGMMNVVAGSFSGTLYEDKPGDVNACRTGTPHTISGEFRLAQAN